MNRLVHVSRGESWRLRHFGLVKEHDIYQVVLLPKAATLASTGKHQRGTKTQAAIANSALLRRQRPESTK